MKSLGSKLYTAKAASLRGATAPVATAEAGWGLALRLRIEQVESFDYAEWSASYKTAGGYETAEVA